MPYELTHPNNTHVAERVRGGYWNVSFTEDRTHSTSGRARGWTFITGGNGTSRYLLRMEDGTLVAHTYRTVPVEHPRGAAAIRVNRFVLEHDGLPDAGEVIVVGKRCGYLSWFGGTPEYNGDNIDGGVIYKVYVSQQHRRKGVATALLNVARDMFPEKDIRHSSALSGAGVDFAAATPTPNDLPYHPSPWIA